MTDPHRQAHRELWQYIPPYTAPNHPPQVEVITTTNTGDTPMTDPDIMDIVTMLQAPDRLEPYLCAAAADEIERLRKERDEARRMYCEAVILHGTAHRFGANGVPEEITEAEELARGLKWDCFKENTND